MDDALAHRRLSEALDLLDRYGDVYDRRWGYSGNVKDPRLDSQLKELEDEVRGRTRFARDVVAAMGENELALRVAKHSEVVSHWFTEARKAIVEAVAILAQREDLAQIVGPVGPQLSASQLHPVIWGAAAALWDDGHFRQAVQTAATALEGLLQAVAGPGVSGENLAILFSLPIQLQARRVFEFVMSTLRQRRGSQRMTARPLWSGARSWVSATWCLTLDGPSRLPARLLRCSPF